MGYHASYIYVYSKLTTGHVYDNLTLTLANSPGHEFAYKDIFSIIWGYIWHA